MKLSTFISQNMEQIIGEWEAFAHTLLPAAAAMTRHGLRNHSRLILEAIAADVAEAPAEHGAGSGAPDLDGRETAAATHGALRHDAGFDLLQLSAEFRALRNSVIRLWMADGMEANESAFQEMLRFNDAVDRALAESIARYAEEVERSRNMFLAILGHDLRTPLGAIAMTTQYLGLPNVSQGKRTEALARIDRSAAAMNAMIKDLLEFTKTRLGKGIPINTEAADMRRICHSALEEVRMAHPLREFRLDMEGNLDGVVDSDRLKQVLWNLLNNAVQHGAREHPIALEACGEADTLVLRVCNRGPAISADALQVIFNPLVQVDDAASPAANLGLGLFIAREIVQAHGGSITATSSDDAGTVFELRLPRTPPEIFRARDA